MDYAFDAFYSDNYCALLFECLHTKKVHHFVISSALNQTKELLEFREKLKSTDRFIGYENANAKFTVFEHACKSMSVGLATTNGCLILESYYNTIKRQRDELIQRELKAVVIDLQHVISDTDAISIQEAMMTAKSYCILPDIKRSGRSLALGESDTVLPFLKNNTTGIKDIFLQSKDKVNQRFVLSKIARENLFHLPYKEAAERTLLNLIGMKDPVRKDNLMDYKKSAKKFTRFYMANVVPHELLTDPIYYNIQKFDSPFERYLNLDSVEYTETIGDDTVFHDDITYNYANNGVYAYAGEGIYESSADNIIVSLDISSVTSHLMIEYDIYPQNLKPIMKEIAKLFIDMQGKSLAIAKDPLAYVVVAKLLNYLANSYSDKSSAFYDVPAHCTLLLRIHYVVTEIIVEILNSLNGKIIQVDKDRIIFSMKPTLIERLCAIEEGFDDSHGIGLHHEFYSSYYSLSENDSMAPLCDEEFKDVRDDKSAVIVDYEGDIFRKENIIGKKFIPIAVGKALYEILNYGNYDVEEVFEEFEDVRDFTMFASVSKPDHSLFIGEVRCSNNLRYYYSRTGPMLFEADFIDVKRSLTPSIGVSEMKVTSKGLPKDFSIRPYVIQVKKVIDSLMVKQLSFF